MVAKSTVEKYRIRATGAPSPTEPQGMAVSLTDPPRRTGSHNPRVDPTACELAMAAFPDTAFWCQAC